MTTWLPLPERSGFGVENLPYGVFSVGGGGGRRVGVAIGDRVLDAAAVAEGLRLDFADLLAQPALNRLMAAGPGTWREVRERITGWLTEPAHRAAVEAHLHPLTGVRLHLPFEVADYVDFYASEHHATNAGKIFRPGQTPLVPNWKHLPVGYHGRASSIVVSGTPVVRPRGQRREPGADAPTFGPSTRLDLEAEVGFVVGAPPPRGTPVELSGFARHVFGACLVNDWSARDVQAWEAVPLGPFLGKSFATSVSPWVVGLAALEAARVAPPRRDHELLPYLRDGDAPWGLDLTLEVRLNGHVLARPPFSAMYWTAAQQLAHLTVNGAPLSVGDLYASGTVSGPRPDQRGSLLELSWGGQTPIELPDGTTRTFLEDGDEVTITATAPGPGGTTIAFGEVSGRVLPASIQP